MKQILRTIIGAFVALVVCGCSERPSMIGPGGSVNRTGVWEFQNPRTTAYDLNDLQILPSGVGWAVGDGGTVLQTMDGGESWSRTEFPEKIDLHGVAFWNDDRGVIVGGSEFGSELWQNGRIFFTENGGRTWQSSAIIVSGWFADVSLIKDGYAFAVGHGPCLLTTDWGESWTKPFVAPVGEARAVDFVDSKHGWTTGDSRSVSRTIDGGLTWMTFRYLPTPDERFDPYPRDIDFVDSLSGWILSWSGEQYRTIDGGLTWSRQTPGFPSFAEEIVFVSEKHGFVASGAVWETTDGGDSWRRVSNTPSGVDGLFLRDGYSFQEVFAFGSLGTVVKSSDYFRSHRETNAFTRQGFQQVQFVDERTGWVGGGGDTVFRTEDGGVNWRPSAVESGGNPIIAMYFLNSLQGVAADNAGLLYRTVTGGTKWISVANPTKQRVGSFSFPDVSHGWALGADGALLQSLDGGSSWRLQYEFGTNMPAKLVFVTPQVGLYVDISGVVTRSVDGGKTWAPIDTFLVDHVEFNEIFTLDPENTWIAGWGNNVWWSGNAGVTWERRSGWAEISNDWPLIYRISFADADHGWKIYTPGGIGDVLASSSDGGRTWKNELLPLTTTYYDAPFTSISTPDANNIWAAGSFGLIAHGDYSGTGLK